jgi:hypothetical protein|tara:strand:- start:116 stop:1258 length:1143 start_codon:yes stop_codon:yes gene_type:complete
MLLSDYDAAWAANEFIDYFGKFESIEDYVRLTKEAALEKRGASLFSLKDEFFNEDIHPEEMEFSIMPVGKRTDVFHSTHALSQSQFLEYLTATSSHVIEHNIPGRELRWMVYEKNSSKIVGFIRFGSPTINSKPRNEWLGEPANLERLNRHAVMGFCIVPSQPFGYNYLGGKLLALMCISHYAREKLNDTFEKDIALFETTSLYGSTTSASQYDGLKPFMRYKGLTDSKFLPLLHNDVFHKLHDRFTLLNNNTPLTENRASSKKLKRQTKMISIIRNSLKNNEQLDKLKEFESVISMAFNLTQRKRFYISDYGYENVREVILGEQDDLRRGQNWDKFHLDNIISWWKKKAGKRYEKLKSEGRFRTEVELWTEDDDIQIIR